MDGFEELVAEIYRADGYWVRRAVRVELSGEDKRSLNNYSMPHPEIDMVAYKAGSRELLAVECKSYFDSGGVHARDLTRDGANHAGRYKMFLKKDLRDLVLRRLQEQLAFSSAIDGQTTPTLGVVYGHATASNAAQLRKFFKANGWFCHGPEWLRERLERMAIRTYDSQVATAVVKLMSRTQRGAASKRRPETSIEPAAKRIGEVRLD